MTKPIKIDRKTLSAKTVGKYQEHMVTGCSANGPVCLLVTSTIEEARELVANESQLVAALRKHHHNELRKGYDDRPIVLV